VTPPPTGAPVDAGLDAARRALARYDDALTALAVEPSAVLDPNHPARTAFLATVEPGSALVDDVLTDLTDRLVEARSGGGPPHGRPSWEHHATAARRIGDTVDVSWCGRSTGVAVDVATGEVTDGTVTASAGVGLLRRGAGGWVVAALDELDRAVVGDGTGDHAGPPTCPGPG
jgi:hypothetical protein